MIFYMLAKYVPGDIKYLWIFTKFYRHISTNNEANRKFVETCCSYKIVCVKKVRICSLQYLIFQRLLDLNYSPLSTLNEANLTSATQTLNFNPMIHYRAKTSQPDGKIRN
jgi:hypothetical protein